MASDIRLKLSIDDAKALKDAVGEAISRGSDNLDVMQSLIDIFRQLDEKLDYDEM